MKFSDSEVMIFEFYMTKLRSVPIFTLFENDSKTNYFSSWELLMKFSDSDIMIFECYTSKFRSVPIFSSFENDSKINIFTSMRALDEIFGFWDYDFRILHDEIKKYANFHFIWEWLQNQHFLLRESSWWNFQSLRLWFLNSTWQN